METSRTASTFRGRPALARAGALLTIVAALWIAVAPVAAGAATPGDWTQAQGSAGHDGTSAEAPAPPYVEAWSAQVPPGGPNNQFGLSAPVIAGDVAVTVAPEQVMGFDLESGTAAFTRERLLGPSVPPALATVGSRTAVVYTEGFGDEPPSAVPTSGSPSAVPTSGSPSAVPTSGSPSSASPTGSPPTGTPSPSASGSPAVTTSRGSFLAAFDLETQEPLWPPLALDQASRSGVTVDGETAYVGDDLGNVYAIDLAEGAVLWKVGAGGPLVAPLTVSGDRLIATVPGSGQRRSVVVALGLADGQQAWRTEADGLGAIISGASASGDTVYAVFPDNTLRAMASSDGSLRWRGRLNAPVNPSATPAATPQAVYALDVFGQLYAFDAATGDRAWDFAINETVFRGSPVVAGDHVLASTGRGRLAAVDPETGHLVWESGTTGFLLRSLTPTPSLILAVRGGVGAGLVAFSHDEHGALVDVVSPTVFAASRFARNFALSALPLLVVLLLLGRLLSARMGPAFIVEDDGEGGEGLHGPDAGGTEEDGA